MLGIVGVQSPESVDEGQSCRRTFSGGIADRMVPANSRDTSLAQQSADGRGASLHCEIRSLAEIQGSFSRIGRGDVGAHESPTAIENSLAKVFGNVDLR